jgi:hypothetical protein
LTNLLIPLLRKVVMHVCRKIWWLLIVLTLVLFTSTHAIMVLPSITSFDGIEQFSEFSQAIKFVWFAFLGDYSLLSPWPNNPWLDIGRVAYSFFSSILILNILSMYNICKSSFFSAFDSFFLTFFFLTVAIVNNVYDNVRERAYTEWTMVRLQLIVMIELVMLLPSERQKEYAQI